MYRKIKSVNSCNFWSPTPRETRSYGMQESGVRQHFDESHVLKTCFRSKHLIYPFALLAKALHHYSYSNGFEMVF